MGDDVLPFRFDVLIKLKFWVCVGLSLVVGFVSHHSKFLFFLDRLTSGTHVEGFNAKLFTFPPRLRTRIIFLA